MKRSILIAVAAVAFLLPTSAASAREDGRPIAAEMTGAAERPGPDRAPAQEIVRDPRAL